MHFIISHSALGKTRLSLSQQVHNALVSFIWSMWTTSPVWFIIGQLWRSITNSELLTLSRNELVRKTIQKSLQDLCPYWLRQSHQSSFSGGRFLIYGSGLQVDREEGRVGRNQQKWFSQLLLFCCRGASNKLLVFVQNEAQDLHSSKKILDTAPGLTEVWPPKTYMFG